MSRHRVFRPDAVVVCPAAPPEEQATSTPLIAIEVLSPSTASTDRLKVDSYFSLSSLAHYLILDPDRRTLTHYARAAGGVAEPRSFREGALRLDPPGIDLEVADMLGPVD